MHNEKYIGIVFDMTIIAINVTNVIKKRLFKDAIEDVAARLNAEPQSMFSVF